MERGGALSRLNELSESDSEKGAHLEASSAVLTNHEGQAPGQSPRPFSTRRLAQNRPRFEELSISGIDVTQDVTSSTKERRKRIEKKNTTRGHRLGR